MTSMTITAKDVQELRQRTGAGMMDCKSALVETGGDMDKAVENLRKKGIAKAEKRAGRVASEGRIVSIVAPDAKSGAVLELNSETDFVSRNEEFAALAQSLAEQVMQDISLDGIVSEASGSALLSQPYHRDPSKTVEEVVKAASGKTGENVVLRRYARFTTAGTLGTYVHHNGRVVVMVEVTGSDAEPAKELARVVAQHAAGSPTVPQAVRREEIPTEIVDRERRIYEEKTRGEGKPEAIIGKIVDGQIKKFYSEVTLLEQKWIKDEAKSIQNLVDEYSKAVGVPLNVKRFVRYRMGE